MMNQIDLDNQVEDTLHIYTRVSTLEQVKSLDTQKELGIKKANEMDMKYSIWDEGSADGYSTLCDLQPELLNLLTAIKIGWVKHLFVVTNDRLSTNTIALTRIKSDLRCNEVILYTRDGEFDLCDAKDRVLNNLFSSIDEYYKLVTSKHPAYGSSW